jgi:hypothetical protein
MQVAEILVDGVFLAALLTAIACFGCLVCATVLEQHLVRTGRTRLRAESPARATSPARVLAAARSRNVGLTTPSRSTRG